MSKILHASETSVGDINKSLDDVKKQLNTLISSDTEKSVRSIAYEEITNGLSLKNFMSIDSANGQFMLPVRKVDDVQQYMRMTIVTVDGVWSVDLDQKFYVKNEDNSFKEVE